MTCIVGLIKNNKVYMGGDSAGVSGLDITPRKDTKVFKNGKFLIGYTSSFRMGQLLRFKLNVPDQKEEQDDYEYMCTTFMDSVRQILKENGYSKIENNEESIGFFLVGYKGRLYSICSDLQVGESYNNFDSVGCGMKYALGALEVLNHQNLEPREIINKSLEIASTFSAGVRPPFNVIEE